MRCLPICSETTCLVWEMFSLSNAFFLLDIVTVLLHASEPPLRLSPLIVLDSASYLHAKGLELKQEKEKYKPFWLEGILFG